MDGSLYSSSDLAKQLLPGADFDTANAFAVSHISAAIENLAEWKSSNNTNARIDLDAIVREVREMNMSWQSKDAILVALQTAQNASFACEWALPEFKFNEPGFLVTEMGGKSGKTLACKYDNRSIAAELTKTATGEAYYGNALYVIKDFPDLTDEEQECIGRWLTGSQRGTDHVTLQGIANKVAAHQP